MWVISNVARVLGDTDEERAATFLDLWCGYREPQHQAALLAYLAGWDESRAIAALEAAVRLGWARVE